MTTKTLSIQKQIGLHVGCSQAVLLYPSPARIVLLNPGTFLPKVAQPGPLFLPASLAPTAPLWRAAGLGWGLSLLPFKPLGDSNVQGRRPPRSWPKVEQGLARDVWIGWDTFPPSHPQHTHAKAISRVSSPRLPGTCCRAGLRFSPASTS